MTQENLTDLSLENALKLLKEYSCVQIKTIDSISEKQKLSESLLLVISHCEWENLGICAENVSLAFAALKSYLKAFGYQINFELDSLPTIKGPVYLKYNTQKMSHYLDSYTGTYRGVLISCQAEIESLNGVYGYFPLYLYEH
jgi:hypothetical protein